MLYSQEQLAEMGASNVELGRRLAQVSLEGAERAAGVQLKAVRGAVEQGAKNLRSMLGASDMQQALALQSSLVEPAVQNAVAASRELSEILAGTHAEVTRLLEERAAVINGEVMKAVESVTGSYPGGSEVAMAAVRSAFAAAGGAYDSMQRAVRQVVEIAQAGGTVAPGQESPAPARRKATA